MSLVPNSLGEKLGEQEVEDMFREAGIDLDGHVQFNDLVRIMAETG